MEATRKKLEKQLEEKNVYVSESLKDKNEELELLQAKLKDQEDSLDKIQRSCKTAKETIEKQVTEKSELKIKVKSLETQNAAASEQIREKEVSIENLNAELVTTKKELSEKNEVETDLEEGNASLTALRSLFEEKETECTKVRTDLEAEKERNAELLVTIKVLRGLNGMPTTPSPSPSPSPSLTTPALPPPLQAVHTGNRSHSTQQQTPSAAPSLSSSVNTHPGVGQLSRKRASLTPPPLTMAPKAQRTIHISEKSASIKVTAPTTGSNTNTHDDDQSPPNTLEASGIAIPKPNVNSNQPNGPNKSSRDITERNDTPSRLVEATSNIPVKPPPAYSPSSSVSSTLDNESSTKGPSSSSKVSSSVTRPATSSTQGRQRINNNHYNLYIIIKNSNTYSIA